MDKIISELLLPFTRRLTPGSLTAAVFFWGTGLLFFHHFHPQALPRCPTGGADICGLLSEDGNRQMMVGAFVLIAIFITAEGVFARAAEVTQFLSGSRWSKRWLFVWLQHRARENSVRRGYGPRDPSSSSARARRNLHSQLRADRYPQGVPRKPHEDPPRLVDVSLEPTFLGNVFAAMRQHILAVHGLRLHSCWKLLLIVLPDTEKMKLVAPSSVVLARTQGIMWSVLTCLWAVWLPGWLWCIWVLAWLVVAYLAYRSLCSAAGTYCDDLKMIIVANRLRLYEAVNFPLPKSTADELRTGPELSGYLDRHRPPTSVKFRLPTAPADPVH